MATRYVIGEAGARKLTALFNSGTLGPSGSRKNGLAVEDGFEDPFSVRWAESVDGGSWIIWIPDDHALLVNGTELDAGADLDDAEGDYPSGWYILDMISYGTVILNIHIPNDISISPTCNFDSTADTPEDDERVISVCVATVAKNQSTGVVTVNQFVKSAIVIDNTAMAQHLPPSPFNIVKTVTPGVQPVTSYNVTNGTFYFNNELKTVSDYSIPAETLQAGSVYLNGQYNSQTEAWSFSLSNQGLTPSAGTKSVSMKIYDFASGSVSMDYRTTFLTAFYAEDSQKTVYGTDGSTADLTGDIKFMSASDSNVQISVANDQNGDVEVTVGVYYK